MLSRSKEIVIYNAKFDTAFLQAVGLAIDESKIIDTMKEYSDFCRKRNQNGAWRKLVDAARETGYGPFKAHDALNDVKATAHVQKWLDMQRKAIEDANPVRVVNIPRRLATPSLDPNLFEFLARDFQCDEVRKVHKSTCAILESRMTFYADGDLIKKLYADIRKLEKQIDRPALGLNDEAMKAKRSIRATKAVTDRTPTFEIAPLTPTGKKPKFILKATLSESKWDEKRYMMTDGLVAELHYLQNGELGKASLKYFSSGNSFDVQFKEEKMSAVLSRIDYMNARTRDTTRLF